jgi:outer membrane protein assembly factor BamB
MKPTFALILTMTVLGSIPAADWTRFRGENGTGHAEGDYPIPFDTTANLAWKVKLPGIGHGSPIVVKDRAFLQVAKKDASAVSLVCIDVAKGDIEWSKGIDIKPGKFHKKNNMASSTPCSDGERVFIVFWDGDGLNLYAYDLKGKELWNKPLGKFTSEHGAGHSPMTTDGLVIVNFDQDKKSELMAFDAKSGEPKWTAKREGHRACYTVPFLRSTGNETKELVVGSTTTLTAYNPATGKPNWDFKLTWGDGKQLRAVGQPVEVNGHVLLYTGEGGTGRYMVSVTPTTDGKAKLDWDMKKGTPYVPGVVVVKDHAYWISDDGIAGCMNVATGKMAWSERLLAKGVSSSPILLGDQLLVIGEDGVCASFKASTTGLEKNSGASLGEAVFATPAAANGKLYIRGADTLFCFKK